MFCGIRVLAFFATLTLVFMSLCSVVSADGFVLTGSAYLTEKAQYSVINYINGTQKMLITINFDKDTTEDTAWILPIPSDSNKTRVDIVNAIPLVGMGSAEVNEQAKQDLEDLRWMRDTTVIASLISPTLAAYLFNTHLSATSGGVDSTGIALISHVEKYGISAELILAKQGADIYNYLTNKSLNISRGVITQLDTYVNKNYSFVISWISDANKTTKTPAIIIEFPTDRIYYPLLLTSIYNNTKIPLEVVIMGYVTPSIYDRIKQYTTVKYYKYGYLMLTGDSSEVPVQKVYDFMGEIESSWGGSNFTVINIKAPSSCFTDDLWMDKNTPRSVEKAIYFHNTFGKNSGFEIIFLPLTAISVFFIILLSILIFGATKNNYYLYGIEVFGFLLGGIMGLTIGMLVIYKKRKPSWKRFAIFVPLFYAMVVISAYMWFDQFAVIFNGI